MFTTELELKCLHTISRQARKDHARSHFELVEKERLITLTN